jgi:hypothetical protein
MLQPDSDLDPDSLYASTEDYQSLQGSQCEEEGYHSEGQVGDPSKGWWSYFDEEDEEEEEDEDEEYQPDAVQEDEDEEDDRIRVDAYAAVTKPDSPDCVVSVMQVVARRKAPDGFQYKIECRNPADGRAEEFWTMINEADDTLRVLMRHYDKESESLRGNAQVVGRRTSKNGMLEYKVQFASGNVRWTSYERATKYIQRLIRGYQLKAQEILDVTFDRDLLMQNDEILSFADLCGPAPSRDMIPILFGERKIHNKNYHRFCYLFAEQLEKLKLFEHLTDALAEHSKIRHTCAVLFEYLLVSNSLESFEIDESIEFINSHFSSLLKAIPTLEEHEKLLAFAKKLKCLQPASCLHSFTSCMSYLYRKFENAEISQLWLTCNQQLMRTLLAKRLERKTLHAEYLDAVQRLPIIDSSELSASFNAVEFSMNCMHENVDSLNDSYMAQLYIRGLIWKLQNHFAPVSPYEMIHFLFLIENDEDRLLELRSPKHYKSLKLSEDEALGKYVLFYYNIIRARLCRLKQKDNVFSLTDGPDLKKGSRSVFWIDENGRNLSVSNYRYFLKALIYESLRIDKDPLRLRNTYSSLCFKSFR